MKRVFFKSLKSLVFLLLLVCIQSAEAQPNPCNCDPFDSDCLANCSGGGGGEVPAPCPCDPFDIDCLEDHPECQDENKVPVNGNIGFLAFAVMCFGIYKIVINQAYEKESNSRFIRLSYVRYYQLRKLLSK
jgi:hypothetical protein